ncbi:DUF6602 domain-containing protein [Antrihabitans stalactiti]|uniref:DUF6602 domain-containing protein n=1 Tax=Antrihabitans stalactiti TaxID=2584121 RepID=A0A848KF58_9NOCA|nr:DUF6602 domain-containing protein [Antrihabitans stalactiti]NMN94820.1 hypothetical protein [Antrihabitans stalactiti]
MTDAPEDPILRTRFEDVLGIVERRLAHSLEEARAGMEHKGNKGSAVEAATRDTLRKYLPRHLDVGHGEIYDAFGDGTGQVDIIVTNDEHPIRYPNDEPGPHIFDGVAAVGEVKSILTTTNLREIIESASKVKRLRTTPIKGDVVTNQSPEYQAKTLCLPPYFVVALENRIAMPTIREILTLAPLVEPPDGKDGPAQHAVDAVFVLGESVCWNLRSGQGPILLGQPPLTGWTSFSTHVPLAWMIGWLHKAMPRIRRTESVMTPYLFPFDEHKAYMAQQSASFEFSDDRS